MAEYARSTDAIQPFWQRLPETFVTAGMVVASIVPGIIGLLAGFVVLSSLFKMCFEVLNATARGRMEPPESTLGRFGGSIFWSQLGLWIVLGLLVTHAFKTAPLFLALLVSAAVVFSIPAMTIVLAFDKSLFSALNPAIFLGMIGRIGKPYALLCLLLALLLLSLNLGSKLAAFIFGTFLGSLLVSALNVYFMLVMFHLMGYVVYQYHEELGLEVDEEGVGGGTLGEQAHPALAEARELLHEGNDDAARQLLAAAIADRGAGIDIHLLYHDTLDRAEDRAEHLRHTHVLTALLLNQDRDDEAFFRVKMALELDPAFQLTDGDSATRLAGKSLNKGDHRTAFRLLKDFARRFPGHSDIPENYLTMAKILSEREGKDKQALDLLKRLRATFPDHPATPRIDEYLQSVERLIASKPR
jgi:tetratricopeptide (TPR) repeat protein